jgi:hypothetical protein
MIAFLRFVAGIILGTVFVVGCGAIGYIVFEQFGLLVPLTIAGIITLLLLDITAITSFPKAITAGLIVPQITLLMGLGVLYADKKISLYFTDDFAYRSCVGNFDHEQGISDCTKLLTKLEGKGHIVLKEIENTGGDYWLAEVLSYRGRHYIRNRQIDLGKADFARALLLPDGVAVTVNNLAEAGFTRSDLYEQDYQELLSDMSENSRCMASASKLKKQDDALKFSNSVSSRTLDAIKLCRLSTGREEIDCERKVNENMRSIISLANRFYVDASNAELQADFNLCLAR